MKRKVWLCMLALLFAFALAVPGNAMAATQKSLGSDIIMQPMWTYLDYIHNDFSINSSGVASMSSSISCDNSYVDNVKMTNLLQRYQSGSWSTVTTWTKTADGDATSWSKTYTVSSGYTYRLLTYFYCYHGTTLLENSSTVSDTDSY
jgi:hypothetical protein